MEKYFRLFLIPFAALALTACGNKQAETQTSSSSTEVSSSKEEVKDTGQVHYQPVLDRYQNYQAALSTKDRTRLEAELSKIEKFSDEYLLVYALGDYGSAPALQYAFTDLNKDGQDELLIGNPESVSAIYYLKGKQPEVLHVAYVGTVGGSRSGFAFYDNGQVSYASWQSVATEANIKLYSFTPRGVNLDKEATYPIGGEETSEQILGITAGQTDISQFEWKAFETSSSASSDANQQESEKAKTTGMDINALVNGDFSSIAGTWQRADGTYPLKFDATGLIENESILQPPRLKDGYAETTIGEAIPNPASSTAVFFYPAGYSSPYADMMGDFDPSDKSKDRIYITKVGPWNGDYFYYRVN